MKKIYYLLAFVAVVFASCDPLSKTYKDLDAIPAKAGAPITISSTTTYRSVTDANTRIPVTLAANYPNLVNGSSINVTFSLSNGFSNIQVPDSTTTKVSFSLVATDYTFPATTLPNGIPVGANTTAYFTAAGVLNYLNYKYPTPVANQEVVLTYLYFETNGTPTTGTQVTDTFIYLASGWTKTYTISNAQYASVNRGTSNAFIITTDYPALASYFNTFLSSDPIVMASAKTGAVVYVSYKIGTFTKIMALTYDGSSWLLKLTLPYLKLAGTWLPDPTVYITIPVSANNQFYTYLKTLPIGSDDARTNVASFGDFDIRTNGGTTNWNDADVTAGLAAILLHFYPTATVGVPYKVTYSVYTGVVSATSKIFVYDGTKFNLQQ